MLETAKLSGKSTLNLAANQKRITQRLTDAQRDSLTAVLNTEVTLHTNLIFNELKINFVIFFLKKVCKQL